MRVSCQYASDHKGQSDGAVPEDQSGKRAGQRHTGKISGSGLGLWIANTFIMSSGGKLEALSPGEGQGTTVRILFPISRDLNEAEVAAQEA